MIFLMLMSLFFSFVLIAGYSMRGVRVGIVYLILDIARPAILRRAFLIPSAVYSYLIAGV